MDGRLSDDGPIWMLFLGLITMFIAGAVGAPAWFTVGLVLAFASFSFIAFRQVTKVPIVPVAFIAAFLALGMGLAIAYEDADVADGTVLGFHPATAALVYLVWIPGFFTVGVAYAWLARRREQDGTDPTAAEGDAREGVA